MEPRIDQNLTISGEPDRWVHSACVLCSNGCGMDIAVKDNQIVGVRGRADHPVSFGHLGARTIGGTVMLQPGPEAKARAEAATHGQNPSRPGSNGS